jgi:hypothetical protein
MKLFTLIAAIIFLNACTNNSPTNRVAQLAGMYKLYLMENQDSLGFWHQDKWAKDGTGYIVYDGKGHMAVQITPKGYKDFKWMSEDETIDEKYVKEKMDSMSLAELKNALAEFTSNYVYVANYSVDDTADVVTHYRVSHTVPSAWNTSRKRKFSFSGDTLILQILDGNRRLKWIKQN